MCDKQRNESMESLISSDQHGAVWVVLLTAAAFGIWAERFRWGALLSGAIVTMLATTLLSNIGVLPVQSSTYEVVWSYLVPFAIPFLLLQANLFRIIRDSGPTLVAFLGGVIGTMLGVVVGFELIPLGKEAWKLASVFCATYIGGSVNYMATAQAIDLRAGDVLTAGAAADNLMMTAYFLVLFAIPSIGLISRRFHYRPDETHFSRSSPAPSMIEPTQKPHYFYQAVAVFVAASCCVLGFVLASVLNLQNGTVLIITVLTVSSATLFPSFFQRMEGTERFGMWLMQIFFATIGATAHVTRVMEYGPALFFFAAVILAVHLLVILGVGKVARIGLPEILIASNANMGGPTTAAAMAAARQWGHLVIPAVLCGTLGYAIATFIGVLVGSWLKA